MEIGEKKQALKVSLSMELSDLLKKIEEVTNYSEVKIKQWDTDFNTWLTVQKTSDLSILDEAQFKVLYIMCVSSCACIQIMLAGTWNTTTSR